MKLLTIIVVLTLIASYYCAPDCAAYCTQIQSVCNMTNLQYKDQTDCMRHCAAYPVGTDADMAGNTVGCRAYHAGAASGNAGLHCPHAGPSGGGACGSICEAYCNITMTACTGAANSVYSSNAICMAHCEGFNTSGLIGAVSGATYQCHLYHAGVALTDAASATTHCPHAGASSAGVCGSKCENLCQVAISACTGTDASWKAADCMAFCDTLPTAGVTNATGGNSVDCRIYHAGAAKALGMLSVHCPHSTHSGGGVCGSYCDTYCYLSMTHCTGSNSHNFTDNAACMTACNGFNQTGMPGETAGNTVQCRIYHIGAAKALNLLSVHCPHGAPTPAAGTPCAASGGTTSSTTSSTTSTSDKGTGNAMGVVISLFSLVAFLLI